MTKERVEEALRGFQNIWRQQYPEKGERRRRYQSIDLAALQEAWNVYIKANKLYHDGRYVPASDPNYLK